MAIFNPYDEEDDGLSTAALGQSATRPPAGASPTSTANPSSPNRFINFSSYFNANKGTAENKANELMGGLGNAAQATLDTSKKDKDTSIAASNASRGMAPPTDPQALAVEDANREKQEEYYPGSTSGPGMSPTGAGPTPDQIGQHYAGTAMSAQATTQKLNQTTDAEGVKALQGGTGFNAALTSAAAGGRMADLRKKYGGLMGQVDADRKEAEGAAVSSMGERATNAGKWDEFDRKRSADFAKSQAEAQEKHDAPVRAAEAEVLRLKQEGNSRKRYQDSNAWLYLPYEEWLRFGSPGLSSDGAEARATIEKAKRKYAENAALQARYG